MLTSLSHVLTPAHRDGYAIPAFNINNLETLLAVVEAARAEQSPVIIQTSEGAVDYAGMDALGGMVHGVARDPHFKSLPIVFHFDHGKNIKMVEAAIKSGWYTSVMVDASTHPFKKNIAITRRIVQMAHRKDISVEAELGAIAGIEDFVNVKDRDTHLTDPAQAAEFVKVTGCDALAVAIGTAHGAYKYHGEAKLDIARLKKIKAVVGVPLVLHGASGVPAQIKKLCMQYGCKIASAKGVPDSQIKAAVRAGISKVNIDTDLRIAFDAGVRQFLAHNPEVINPREILSDAKALMTRIARQKIRLLSS